jgi:hypothetical protein
LPSTIENDPSPAARIAMIEGGSHRLAYCPHCIGAKRRYDFPFKS